MSKILVFLNLLVIFHFLGINCASAAPQDTTFVKKYKDFKDFFPLPVRDECVYLKGVNIAIIDWNNPLVEGLEQGNNSWYRQVNWSQQPRDYLTVKYTIWKKNSQKVAENSIFLCASKPGTEAGEIAKLIREALGIGERCPINLGMNKIDPALFDGKKCRDLHLRMRLGSDLYHIFFEVKSEGLSHDLMNGFVKISSDPLQ